MPSQAQVWRDVQARLASGQGFWVYAYGSLIWKPAFEPLQALPARVWGHHRALRMRSLRDRGTPQRPGLVFALLPGGCCTGVVQRVPDDQAEAVFETLWQREMEGSPYRPHWLRARTGNGPVSALGFTLPGQSERHARELGEAELLDILRHACGRHGSTLDYLLDTARALQQHGIHDPQVQALVAMARRHGLHRADAGR
ncbi:gamma-glutamylcyclotransferase [Sphaerotilus mobilis]|uniref:glutathione-specific gamma-glutamylcyclotransferase n=1 Tax=Sphaerotilus mobilis TaxID=47994 RepID=A0A4Q7LWY3_9BURK|nr:gamma-glutamylcyclotransferase [Sphaerotilus mobilis]RZS58708.1 cation transport protein ChaC [Sphaerotilus mobilis]